MAWKISHLQALEAESIQIIREVAAEFQRPVMLYSIGKDSSVMLRLAQKAFHPGPIPFPLLHVDTTYKFKEMIEFRDRHAAELGCKLIVHTNHAALERGRESVPAGHGALLRAAQDHSSARCAAGGQLRRGVRRRAPGRGKIARQGTHFFLPRHARAVGSQESAAGAVEHLQQPRGAGREHPRVPALELDRAGRVAVHPRGKHSDRAAVLRQGAPDAGARQFADHAGAGFRAAARAIRYEIGEVPHAVAGMLAVHGRDSLGCGYDARRSSPNWWRCGIRSARIG